jgi:2-oxo-4-hydroxy-4-carboxy-5-ureidoimidazoline decarboxylase
MEPWRLLDAASSDEARRLLTTCCGATTWVDRMLGHRPFGDHASLLAAARTEWRSLTRADWLEAFAHHPRIGDRSALRARFPETAHLSEREQSGVAGAPEDVLNALETANGEYEEKFGYIFIVCATGKTAGEMLKLLRARMENDPTVELAIAAAEQMKITELRLDQLKGAT